MDLKSLEQDKININNINKTNNKKNLNDKINKNKQ